MQKKKKILTIYKIDDGDIEAAIKKVSTGDFHKRIKNKKWLDNKDKLKFDINSRFIAVYGKKDVSVFDIDEHDEAKP